MRYQKPKGTVDILPGESEHWQYVEAVAKKVFNNYQYHEIRTPLFEQYDVFARSSGDTSDIVSKEMYDFKDKAGRHMALRPEGTAGVVRAYVENKLFGPDQVRPYKVWYKGPMFRYERPQSGRQREFNQIGVESFGSDSPAMDVESISMAVNFLTELGLKNYKVVINTLGDKETRAAYHQALINYLTPFKDQLSDDSKIRLEKNPLRILDSKDKNDQKIVADAPSILDYLTDDAKNHFAQVKKMLDEVGIEYVVDSTMVRGLDYYNHTIFEIMVTSEVFGGGEMTVIAGGRYDGLVKQLGGPEVSGVGFAMGVERLMLLLEHENHNLPNVIGPDIYVVSVDDSTSSTVTKIVNQLRFEGISAERDYLDKKVKGQFKTANRLNAKYTLTIGEDEMNTGKGELKRMSDGETFAVELDHLAAQLTKIEGDK